MSFLFLPTNDIPVKEIARVAGLEGKVRKKVYSVECCGFIHSLIRLKDERGKEAIVSVLPASGDIEVSVIEDDGGEDSSQ